MEKLIHNLMKKAINGALTALTLVCIYIIFNIGLGWFWPIGTCENYEKVNQVLINISYSYIAGLIFYLLVTYLPYLQRRRKLLPAIKLKINDLNSQINACIQTFEKEENSVLVDMVTRERLSFLINNNGMYENSFYANVVGYNMNNLKFLVSTKDIIFDLIAQILTYKEYLTEEQILNIEKIHDSTYFHLTKIYEETPTAKYYYSSSQFKQTLCEELNLVIGYTKRLKQSLL